MSDSAGQKEATTFQDESVADQEQIAFKLGVEAIIPQEFNVSSNDGASYGAQKEATQTEDQPGVAQQPELKSYNGMNTGAIVDRRDEIDMDTTESSPSAREIEREASEHMARRAAEMSSSTGDNEAKPESHAPNETTETSALLSVSNVPDKDVSPLTAPSPEPDYEEKHPPPAPDAANDVPEVLQGNTESTGLEIQTIMDQFQEGLGLGEREIMSPRLEKQQPVLVLPPRTSSLENRDHSALSPQTTGGSIASGSFSPQRSVDTASVSGQSLNRVKTEDNESIISGKASSIFQPPPPSPDPEPSLPFDFHRFLEQLRHRTADPVARFLRSFLSEFGKKQWMVHEQVKIISDFLEFISKKMMQCDVWRTVSDAEFDNAREGMEKLVMNRLYSQTFSPAIAPVVGSPRKTGKNGRTAADMANPHGPGRRGQHQEDTERDEVIAQKIRIYGWIEERHLDMGPINDKGRKFLGLAQQELLKINTYRAPRDKVICVLNCCKVIFGFLKNAKFDTSADAFVPLLIYTVLRARPEHLVSNVQYIWRFRDQDKLGGEAGYYMSSLMGVVTFIENLDRTNLTITDEEFEQNVEQAVSAIAEKNKAEEDEKSNTSAPSTSMPRLNEKSTLSRAEVTPRHSLEAEQVSPRRNVSQKSQQSQAGSGSDDDFDAVTGLLKTIQKPLSSIGRIFSDDGPSQKGSLRPASTPLPGSTPSPRGTSPAPNSEKRPDLPGNKPNTATEAAARQASAEAAQAHKVRAKEHTVVVETLQSMFPNLDREVIEDVVRAQEGNVGKAVDACLALSG